MNTFRHRLQEICDAAPEFEWLSLLRDGVWVSYNYRELKARAADYCAFYAEQKLDAGDTVLIILKESLDLFASFFAGIASGVLPAYSAYPSPKQSAELFLESVGDLVRYNEIRVVVGYSAVVTLLKAEQRIKSDRFLGYFVADEVALGRNYSLAELAPRTEAFLQFSSGTTGAKKGVRVSAQALFNQMAAYCPQLGFDTSSRVVSWLPHYHDMGLVTGMLIPFLKQVPVTMMSPFDWVRNPGLLLTAITEHRGTHVWLPNFALDHLTRSVSVDRLGQYDLSSLKQLIACSEPVLHATVERFVEKFGRCGLNGDVIVNCYAMAENTFAATSSNTGALNFLNVDRTELRQGRVVVTGDGDLICSTGKPLTNAEVGILDKKQTELSEDRVGEITLRTDCMLDHYHNNPEATTAAMRNGWYHSGDLGFLHGGELYVTGRIKDMIIVGGENFYPQDVELILNNDKRLIPGRNVVFGVSDERIGTERIVALAEARHAHLNADTSDLRQEVFSRLNVSLSEIHLLPHKTLRKGTAGKISRHLNKQEYLKGRSDEQGTTSGDDLLSVVQAIVPEGARSTLTRETKLLSSGLIDSFNFVQLVQAVEKYTGHRIPERLWTTERFDTVGDIEATAAGGIRDSSELNGDQEEIRRHRAASLEELSKPAGAASPAPFCEWLINSVPVRNSHIYRALLRLAGVKVGRNVSFLGCIHVKLRGKPSNIIIGDNVVLGDRVDLRIRENGRIVLGRGCYLDAHVRIVAAREGCVVLATGSAIGIGSVVNSGGDTYIGKFTLIGGSVQINSSSHGIDRSSFIKGQSYDHGSVKIGDDVWIGAGASILINSNIGEGAVIASNSLVSGDIPPFAICAGVPARVIKYR